MQVVDQRPLRRTYTQYLYATHHKGMSEKNCDIILMISFTICLILMIVRFVRLIIIGLEPLNLITFGIAFFFLLGWAMIFICLKHHC